MKNLVRAAAIFSGVVGLSGVAAALSVGCSGDDTVVGYGNDSGNDVTVPDSAADTSIADSASDAFYFDAGPPDLSKFYLQITQTGCAWLQNCCAGTADFNVNTCISTFSPATGGFLFTSPVQDTIDGGGQVELNTAEATQCLSLIQNLSCTDPFTSAQVKAIRDACNAAVVGKIPVGSTGCQETIECQSPGHCELGTCVPPYDAGTPCIVGNDTIEDSLSRCGRGYTGVPGFCEVGQFDTVSEAGVCSPQTANGQPCDSPYECQSWLCDVNNTGNCVDSAQIFISGAGGTCAQFPSPDAGDGG